MRIGKLIIGFTLLVATAALADPIGKVINVPPTAACTARADAEALAKVAVDDVTYGQQLFEALAGERRCRSYSGMATIDKVILNVDPFWVLQVTTLKDGTLYLVYSEPQEEQVETALMDSTQGRR